MLASLWLGSADVPAAVSATPTASDISRQIEFRREFGLDTAVADVNALQANPPSAVWGVPLTAAEEQELGRRARISEGIGSLQMAVESEPGFSALYLDQAGGGVIHVLALPTSRTRFEELVARYAPRDAVVVVENAAYTYTELQELRLQIRSLMLAGSIDVSSLTVDVVGNRVAVGLNPPTFTADSGFLAEKFPDAPLWIFEQPHPDPASCTQAACWPPSRGGIQVSTSYICTSTFNAKNSSGNVFLVTAGHCASETTPGLTGVSFYHNGINRGKNTINSWKGSSAYADATIIDINNADVSNLIYVTSTTQRGMTSKKALNAGVVGDAICANGIVTAFFCGTIKNVDIDVNNGVQLLSQRLASIDIAQGDSGATVFYGTTLHGLVHTVAGTVVKTTPKTWSDLYYTQVRDVEIQLGVSAVLN